MRTGGFNQVLLLLVAALFLSACGTSAPPATESQPAAPTTDSQPATDTQPAPDPEPEPPPPATVRWGQAVYSAAYWAHYVGDVQGFFAAEGITRDVHLIPSGPNLMAAMEGGDLDVIVAATDLYIQAINKGVDTVAVAGMQRLSALSMIAPPGTTSVMDLKGGVMAATNLQASDAYYLRKFLEKNGLTANDFTVVAQGSFPQRAAALEAGQVKGAMLTEPWQSELVAKGYVRLGGAPDGVGRDFNFLNIAARRSWAEQNRDVLVRFLRAYAKADAWLHDPQNKAAAIQILVNPPINIPQDQAERAYKAFVEDQKVVDAQLEPEDVLVTLEIMHEKGDMPELSTDWEKYADLSYWREATQ